MIRVRGLSTASSIGHREPSDGFFPKRKALLLQCENKVNMGNHLLPKALILLVVLPSPEPRDLE
jgi:hypothetical protein